MQKKSFVWSILAVVLVLTMALSACSTPTATPAPTAMEEPTAAPVEVEPTTAPEAPVATEAPTMASGQVEVFSWWTGGGEAAGLEAMIKVFNAKYPDIEFINAAVAGGAGTNARAVLATRLQAGQAPDSWQGHAGQELIGTYVKADQIEPLNFLYEENGWLDVMPETLIPLISDNGNIYSVPVNIHRANVLWYNPTVLQDNNIEVPTTLDEWFAAMDALKAAGMDALWLWANSGPPCTCSKRLCSQLSALINTINYGRASWTGLLRMLPPLLKTSIKP